MVLEWQETVFFLTRRAYAIKIFKYKAQENIIGKEEDACYLFSNMPSISFRLNY